MQRELEGFLAAHGVTPGVPLVAAVSGGPDSMALLHALAAGAHRPHLSVGHVDHGLRPASAAEAAFVAEYCAARGIPCAATRLSVEPGARGNLHARLREARYEFLLGLVPANGFLLTAHHADDQALTMLMRFIEGAALPGLAGMRPRRERILRPLLVATREQLHAYLREQAVPYQLDPSNEDEGKYRNRLRRKLWPLVLAERPQAARLLAESAAALRDDDEALQTLAGELLDGLQWGEGWAELPAPGGTPPAVLRRAVAGVLTGCFDTAAPSLTQWRAAQSAWAGRGAASLPGRVSARPFQDGLLFLSERAPVTYALDIPAPGDYVLSSGVLRVQRVVAPFRVRPAAPGDRVTGASPQGVFDRLAAAGVAAHRRAGWPVITAASGGAVLTVPLPGENARGEWGSASFTERILRGRSLLKRPASRIVETPENGL